MTLHSPLSYRIDIKIGRQITVQVVGRCSLNYIKLVLCSDTVKEPAVSSDSSMYKTNHSITLVLCLTVS